MSLTAEDIFKLAPIIPVITIRDIDDAVPLARALFEGGLPVLEITLRSSVALEAIKIIKKEVPEALVGAGTVLNVNDLDNALEANSEFILTPGISDELLNAAKAQKKPFIPGVATASEIMKCQEAGFNHLKFFPAEANGGPAALRALSGPFNSVSFCPTGGIKPENLKSYLQVPSVKTVGGSWMVPGSCSKDTDWDAVTRQVMAACELVTTIRAS